MSLCSRCGADNPAEARFCLACGSAIERRCARCGTAAPENARFCISCGAALVQEGGNGAAPEVPAEPAAEPAAEPSVAPPAAPASAAFDERRTATILFADLSGYTAIAERLDPEALKRLLERVLARLGQEVERHGGHVDKFIGDNVMAIFGAPVAHGDDAQRAVLAGLGMQAAMEEINAPLELEQGVTFELRIGINTGEVLAGNLGEGYTVIGDSVNVASRLQASARPGSVTVGEETYRATRAAIAYEELPEPLSLKGKAQPVRAWEAQGADAAAEPEDPARWVALVGRRGELAQLHELLDRVEREREPHLATVLGEAGVGKSRLLHQFEEELGRRVPRPRVGRGRCLPYGMSVVYGPLGEMLRAECGIEEGDPPAAAREKLTARVAELLGEDDDAERRAARATLIARAIGVAGEQGEQQEERDPLRARELLFAAVRAFVEGMARDGPVVLIWEDIHWADEAMLDLIEHIGQWSHGPIMQVCLAREELLERRVDWGGVRRGASTIFLDPLGEEDTRRLIGALLGRHQAVEATLAMVAARAEGNPLFAEEIVRHLGEEGASAEELPTSVQAVLAARLDLLEPFQRRLLAHAAVVGRTFWQDALAPVAQAEGGDLDEALHALRTKGLLVSGDGRTGDARQLAFKHALIRDAAYEMLPKATRAQKHFEVAGFIEARSRGRIEEAVPLLAEHYERAAQLASELSFTGEEQEPYRIKALLYLEAAGDAATALYANADAFSSYEAARQRAGEDADALARIAEKQGDVALRLGRVDAAVAVWEHALEHHNSLGANERVAELHRKIGAGLAHKGERKRAIEHHQNGINLIKDGEPSLALVRLYEEAAWLYMQTGDNMLAIYASEKALRLAERLDEIRLASRAHGIFGRVFGRIGDSAKAHENLERAVELARDSDTHETVIALMALGHHLESFDGDYQAAEEAYREGLSLAQRIGDVPAEIELHAALGRLALHAADWAQAEHWSRLSAELCEREGLTGKLCMPFCLQGRLHWRSGQWTPSERAYRRSQELAEQVGWSEVCVDALQGLAATLGDRGDVPGAEAALAQALEICDRAGLTVQSIQAMAALALLHAAAGRGEPAEQTARGAVALAEGVGYPVGKAAGLEAHSLLGGDAEGAAELSQAREAWTALGRPLEAARCELLRGQRLLERDPVEAAAALERAETEFERLGVAHRAARARELAGARLAGSW